jgi:hypothetical protein
VVPILLAGDLALQALSVNCLKGWRTLTSLVAERLVPAIKHRVQFLVKSSLILDFLSLVERIKQAFLIKRYLVATFFDVEIDNNTTNRYRIFQLLIYAN